MLYRSWTINLRTYVISVTAEKRETKNLYIVRESGGLEIEDDGNSKLASHTNKLNEENTHTTHVKYIMHATVHA